MNTREIAKDPAVPVLTGKAIDLLTELCFRRDDDLDIADTLFIFGTSFGIEALAKEASAILDEGLVKNVVVAGGSPSYPDVTRLGRSESREILHAIRPERFPGIIFLSEDESLNTQENVSLSLRFSEFACARKIIFMFRSHACGRGYLTLRRYLPDALLLQRSVSVSYKSGTPPISADTWFYHPLSRSRVWGEFLRIESYGSRGHIEYPPRARDTVSEIRKETTRA